MPEDKRLKMARALLWKGRPMPGPTPELSALANNADSRTQQASNGA